MDATAVLLLFLCVSQGGTIKITGSVPCFLPKLVTVKWHGKSLGILKQCHHHIWQKVLKSYPGSVCIKQSTHYWFSWWFWPCISESYYHLLIITKPRCLFTPWKKFLLSLWTSRVWNHHLIPIWSASCHVPMSQLLLFILS